jgi:hypothetical protein
VKVLLRKDPWSEVSPTPSPVALLLPPPSLLFHPPFLVRTAPALRALRLRRAGTAQAGPSVLLVELLALLPPLSLESSADPALEAQFLVECLTISGKPVERVSLSSYPVHLGGICSTPQGRVGRGGMREILLYRCELRDDRALWLRSP